MYLSERMPGGLLEPCTCSEAPVLRTIATGTKSHKKMAWPGSLLGAEEMVEDT